MTSERRNGTRSGRDLYGFLPVIRIHARARRFYLLFGLLLAAAGTALLVLGYLGDAPVRTSLLPAGAFTLVLSLLPFVEAAEQGERARGLEALAGDWERVRNASGTGPQGPSRAARLLERLYDPRITA